MGVAACTLRSRIPPAPAVHLVVRIVPLDAILPLRHAVLRPGRPLETAHFEGDDEPTTRHVAAVIADHIVGCATVLRRPYEAHDAAQLRGMATDPRHVRRGVGTAVLRYIEQLIARDWRLSLAWCNARTSAIAFYESGGWQIASDEFDVPDVGPHRRMTRQLRVP